MVRVSAFGELFKKRRLALGLTLREFCRKHGLDPGNISKLERGLLAPPAGGGKLAEYAKCLKLPKGSAEREEFIQLGTVCAGRIPDEVLGDEELVKRLPLVFRTLRGGKLSDEQLSDLAEKVRKA